MQEHTGTFIRRRWSVVAETLAAEAGERDIIFVAFSLPKFINSLVTGRTSCLAVNSVAHDPQ